LKDIREIYPHQRIVLCLDQQDEEASDRDIRKKRKVFYEKNGINPGMAFYFIGRNSLVEILAEKTVFTLSADCKTYGCNSLSQTV